MRIFRRLIAAFSSVTQVVQSWMWMRKLPVKQLSKEQYRTVVELHRESFGTFPMELRLYLQTHRNRSLFILESQGEIVGYAFFVARSDEEAHLRNIAVRRSHSGKGLGRTLLEDSLGELKKCFMSASLNVKKDNNGAISLYKKLGVRVSDDRGDAYRMELPLQNWN